MIVDSIIVEENHIPEQLPQERVFYPNVLGTLLALIVERTPFAAGEIIVVTDRLPIQKRRKAVEGAIKETLARILPSEVRYRLIHHDSKSNFDLQIADYFNWAIYRRWSRDDFRSTNPAENQGE